jgi:threonylcarbamoyladenosine tRNA methylthiotransferase MtaB
VLSRVAALAASGVRETVLTGVNLSGYRSGGLDFPGLLETLTGGTRDIAFRISSYEPDRVDGTFARAFSSPRVRPHLHLSVQSGSDSILRAMNRHYGRDAVFRAADAVRSVRSDPFIGADLILGFPGETDADFQQTVALIERLEPAWIHAFTFSPRPGTRAFSMKPCVPERIAVERAAIVQALADRNKAAFIARRLGRTLDAVVEFHGRPDPVTGFVHATSAEYLKLAVSGLPPGFRGSFTSTALSASGRGSADHIPDLRTQYCIKN